MTIEIKKNEKEMTVAVGGRLDTITAPTLEQTLCDNLAEIETLILDLAPNFIFS